jgi:peptidoglycan-N-acetylglucosamine deacetylase
LNIAISFNYYFKTRMLKKILLFLILGFLSACEKTLFEPIQKEVVLTLDDSPGNPENTIKVLDLLRDNNIEATFFCIGKYLRMYPEIATRIAREQTLANHTYTHPNILENNLSDIIDYEIIGNQSLIDSICVANYKRRNRYFRPPYGSLSDSQKSTLSKLGYKCIMWDIDGSDWIAGATVDRITTEVFSKLNQSSGIPIILLHFSDNSVTALDLILKDFKKRNIKVISLREKAYGIPK